MELLSEKQVGELIVEYENRVKVLIEKIKGELQNRKELKKKIEEAKQREALQLQILDRLEESEKLVRKQIDLVAKMEDNESMKQRELIKKYKQMLDEQKSTWLKYKEEYESLPSVKKIRQAEAKYMCASIKHRLLLKKIKDAQRMVQLRELVRKKQEQALVIKFAQLMLDYMKRQKRCQELWNLNRKLVAQAQQLRQQLQEKENFKKQKIDADLQKASVLMKPQQLPQVDLSRFIIHRNKGHDKLDTMSINSYILEEEYINNNGQSSEKLNSSQNKAMDVDTQETMEMEIDTQETDTQETDTQERELVQSNEPPKRLDFKSAPDNEGKTQSTPPVDECNGGEHNRTFDQEKDSQESHPSTSGTTNSTRKRLSQVLQQNKENTLMNANFANDGNIQNEYSTPYQRSIATPAKMSKSTFQEKHPHNQTSKQNTAKSSFQEKHPHSQSTKQQEMMQQQQNNQISKRSSRENQQLQSSSGHSSQEMYEKQSLRQSSQETYQQQQPSRHSSQEMYQQQPTPRQPPQEMYQQQPTPRQPPQEMYQQQQQQQVYQQNQQQQTSHYSAQEIHQQKQHQQDMYLQSEQRKVIHQKIQVTPQNSKQMDFSGLPSAGKPRIVSNEYVNYDLQTLNYKRSSKHQPLSEPTPQPSPEIPRNTSARPKTETTPFAYQVAFGNGVQPSVNVTPMSAIIEPSSMMSTTMHSADTSFNIPDNISAIIGSEITEPGGSFELARRLYDSDLNSEDGELDFDKFMRNACSPIHKISPKVQHPQPPENTSTQPPINNSASQNAEDSNERAFTFGGFVKKQTNTTHRFF